MRNWLRRPGSGLSRKSQHAPVSKEEGEEILLWQTGAPGSAEKSTGEVRNLVGGELILTGIHQPSIIPFFPPPAVATGAALIIAPGGGHRELWMDHEGLRPASWFAERGIAAFVLKYRLSEEKGSGYSLRNHSLPDIRRAIRLVRAQAGSWGIDKSSIGVMGFSAGGGLAALASLGDIGQSTKQPDNIDRESARPDFQVLVYPAGIDDLKPEKKSPPLFLLGGYHDNDDITTGMLALFQEYKAAGAVAEMHLYGDAPHGFGIRERNNGAYTSWPSRVLDWIGAGGFLNKKEK
jgi:endo-1,4-beta-xylanase